MEWIIQTAKAESVNGLISPLWMVPFFVVLVMLCMGAVIIAEFIEATKEKRALSYLQGVSAIFAAIAGGSSSAWTLSQ